MNGPFRFLLCAATCLLVLASCKKTDNLQPGNNDTTVAPPVTGAQLPYNYTNTYFGGGARFDSNAVFATTELDTINGVYGSNKTYENVTQQLRFAFFAPKKSLDTMTRRPFILLIHGGGFLSGSYTSLSAIARSFAVRGYAAATIEYRLGFNLGTIPCVMGDSLEVLKAVYRATQDGNAAMRYFVANATTFGIDTSQLILFGSSAGNVTTTSMIYYPQSYFNSKISNIETTLGSLNNASNNLVNTFNIKFELTYTGYGLLDKSYLTPAKCKPAFYMQGSEDKTLPPSYGAVFLSLCPLGTYGHSYGSLVAKELVKQYKYPYEHYLDQGADHDVSAHYPSTYYVKRMASFVKRLWKGNYRHIEYNTFNQTKNEVITP